MIQRGGGGASGGQAANKLHIQRLENGKSVDEVATYLYLKVTRTPPIHFQKPRFHHCLNILTFTCVVNQGSGLPMSPYVISIGLSFHGITLSILAHTHSSSAAICHHCRGTYPGLTYCVPFRLRDRYFTSIFTRDFRYRMTEMTERLDKMAASSTTASTQRA